MLPRMCVLTAHSLKHVHHDILVTMHKQAEPSLCNLKALVLEEAWFCCWLKVFFILKESEGQAVCTCHRQEHSRLRQRQVLSLGEGGPQEDPKSCKVCHFHRFFLVTNPVLNP